MKIIRASNKQSSFQRYGARMTKFSTNPYLIFLRFECYTTLIVKDILDKDILDIYKYILEIKESLFNKRDRPVLNKNISFAKLSLFDNN